MFALLKLKPHLLLPKYILSLPKLNYPGTPVSPKSKPPSVPAKIPPPDSTTATERPERLEPSPVICRVLPAEWPAAFYNKTGATGFYTFAFTFSIYLMSKEIYVLEHNYYGGVSIFILWALGVKYLGPGIAKSIDKEIDQIETDWSEGRENHKQVLRDQVEFEVFSQQSMSGQLTLLQAKRENVQLQLEAAFRERQMRVYKMVLNRLVYQSELEFIRRRLQHKNIIEWVRNEVIKSFTPEKEAANIAKCFEDLQRFAQAAAK